MRSLLAVALIAGSTSVASAGGYIGLGIGTGPGTSGDLAYKEDGRSGRLQLGFRLGSHLAIEGLGSRADVMYGTSPSSYQWQVLGLAGKYNITLDDGFELYGRLGVQHTSVSDVMDTELHAGNGMLFGGGFEYRVGLGMSASIFIDYTVNRSKLESDRSPGASWDFTSRVWTLGATVGF